MIQITQRLMNKVVVVPCFYGAEAAKNSPANAKHLERVWPDVTVHYNENTKGVASSEHAKALRASLRRNLSRYRFADLAEFVGKSERDETAALRAAKTSLPDPPLR